MRGRHFGKIFKWLVLGITMFIGALSFLDRVVGLDIGGFSEVANYGSGESVEPMTAAEGWFSLAFFGFFGVVLVLVVSYNFVKRARYNRLLESGIRAEANVIAVKRSIISSKDGSSLFLAMVQWTDFEGVVRTGKSGYFSELQCASISDRAVVYYDQDDSRKILVRLRFSEDVAEGG